jgi:hypothetical protein
MRETRNPVPRAASRASRRNFAAANFQVEDNKLPLDLQPVVRRQPAPTVRDAVATVAFDSLDEFADC